MKKHLVLEKNNKKKEIPVGFSKNVFFTGPFFLIKTEDWKNLINYVFFFIIPQIFLILNSPTSDGYFFFLAKLATIYIFSNLIYAFFYNKILLIDHLYKGYNFTKISYFEKTAIEKSVDENLKKINEEKNKSN